MSVLVDVAQAFEEGFKQFEKIIADDDYERFDIQEIYSNTEEYWGNNIPDNRIVSGENLEYMKYLIKEKKMCGKLQLVYMDPPFFSNGKYQASIKIKSDKLGESPLIKTGAYDDCWGGGMKDYITMLTIRFLMIKELLSDTGVLWVHLDWHASHYIKIILDEIFGEKNFRNEIIWTYKSGGANKKTFAKKHDTLLFYSKSAKYTFNRQTEKSYNRGFKPYHFKGVEEFKDDIGWYTKVNMKDVWNIDMVGRTSSERTGYATQKPEKLLQRIISACSNEGDICADFFSGSGTLGAVCSKLNRRWIMCDSGTVAIANQIYRIGKDKQSFAVERSEEGKLRFAKSVVSIEKTDDSVEIVDYSFDTSDLCCSSKEIVKAYIDGDGTSIVKFWAIDTEFNGNHFKVKSLFDADQRKIQIKNNGKHSKNVIIGYNVFGDRFVAEI